MDYEDVARRATLLREAEALEQDCRQELEYDQHADDPFLILHFQRGCAVRRAPCCPLLIRVGADQLPRRRQRSTARLSADFAQDLKAARARLQVLVGGNASRYATKVARRHVDALEAELEAAELEAAEAQFHRSPEADAMRDLADRLAPGPRPGPQE